MTHPLMQFFAHEHLKEKLAGISKKFAETAKNLELSAEGLYVPATQAPTVEELMKSVYELPSNIERDESLRKLRVIHSSIRGFGTPVGALSLNRALRHLLEAKDCAVRALLYKEPESAQD